MPKLAPFIETYSGKAFYFLNPTKDTIDIVDIAHSLSLCCRFTGHSNRFYSVAEHSIFVSYLANDNLAGLLHDASEAYITDIASPIKPHLSNYKELEDMLMGRIAAKFGFTYPLDPDIKDCDATQLKTEAKYLLKSGGHPWAYLYPTRRAHGIKPQCMAPEQAEKAFLERFEEVKNVFTFSTDWPYEDTNSNRNSGYSIPDGWPKGLQLSSGQVPTGSTTGPHSSDRKDCEGQGTRSEVNEQSFSNPENTVRKGLC